MKNLIDTDKIKEVRFLQHGGYTYCKPSMIEFDEKNGLINVSLPLRMPVANVADASVEKCTLKRVISRFFKERKEKRDKLRRLRFILKVTTCSNCGKTLNRCSCNQRYTDSYVRQ